MKNMKRKGFSLIELMAVIVILAVIALIAVPIITSIISDSEEGALKSTVQNLILAVENNCNVEIINDKRQTHIYKLTEQGVFPTVVNLKGKLPKTGYIYVDDECTASAVNLSDGENYVNGTLEELEIAKEVKNISPVEGTTSNYMLIVNGTVVPNSFDIDQINLAEQTINGVFADSDKNVVMNYSGFISKELNINNIKIFVEELKTKELIVNDVNLYDDVYYYIDYENGYSYVFYNECVVSGKCNNSTSIYTVLDVENDEVFAQAGGIIHNF